MQKKMDIKKISVIAMLCAIAYVVMVFIKIPVVSFLSYEPKDVIIAIGGFMYGPLTSVIISVVVSLIEMITVSSTGIIGAVMNIVSTCAFCTVASLIYKKKKTITSAIAGLLSGYIVMIIAMLLWNYILTPIYMGIPREAIKEMLIPVFLVFNALKGGLNMAIVLLIYKPLVTGLRKAGLLKKDDSSDNVTKPSKKQIIMSYVFASVLFITCVLVLLILMNVI